MILDVALGETTGKATPLKHVSNGLLGRPWQVAESTLSGNVRACDEREDISQVVTKELCYIKGDHAQEHTRKAELPCTDCAAVIK